ncbi:MOSC domain-containing protein [Mucilaginibacter segetis]|uniref:MOSC domain-containing protein n=1 Tax=Mucilaginibacter segetis TaxID=2793071 RepID=A0A934PSK0_9SPHI|nr:MOSC N-terminal beta barrel domain-containing protein [Mucilaginibacter segetis]MBK0378841.1 MOSC domain-containing protein [Mucilaginibacter segetis]
MLRISGLYIYPIKSLGGIALTEAKVTDRGLEHDRRWMLVDANNRFLSQREHPQLALFTQELTVNGLKVTYKANGASILIPFKPVKQTQLQVSIWDDVCTAQLVSDEADEWFREKLNIICSLVYMPDETERPTDQKYTEPGNITSFADAYPMLIIGQASLDDLNSKLDAPVRMNRFRPNMVFTGGEAFLEDSMKHIRITGTDLYGVKLCARCVMITIDQATRKKGKEPTKTLATYRQKNNKIYFGQNLISSGNGTIKIGDEIHILETHQEARFFI